MLRKASLRFSALILIAVTLGLEGCVTVDLKNDPAASASGATYDTAMTYLVSARAKLLSKAKNRENFDDATKVGVGVGVGGASIGAVFHSAINPILGFLAFGAVNYSLNRDVNPMTLDGVYRAGVSNLDCIRASAVLTNQNIRDLTPQLSAIQPKLDAAINKVTGDIIAANGDATYALDVNQAVQDVQSAQALSRQIGDYTSTVQVGEQIVAGVDATLTAVNTQALASSPSIDAVLQSGSTFSSAMDTGLQVDTKLQTARNQLTTKPQANGAESIPFAQDRAALKAIVGLIPDLSLGPQLAAIGQCHAQFNVLQPVTVSPSPVALTAGATVALKVTGNNPFYVEWDTAQPANVHVDSGLQVSLSADTGAVAGSSVFHVVDKLGTRSDSVTLNVSAATPVNPQGGGVQPAGPPAPPGGR